jgi:hypothetical protein
MGSEVKMDNPSNLLPFNGALLATARTRQQYLNIRRDEIELPRCTDLVWTVFLQPAPYDRSILQN